MDMKNIVNELLNQIKEDKQKRRKSCAVMLVLSLLVASGVLWQMKITGITMTGEALCGHLEHQHTTQCLGMQVVCGLEESEGHSHTDACKASETVQICQKEVHVHVEGECFTLDAGECEKEEHQHEDACFKTSTSLICGLEESEGHKHVTECEREVYICGYEKEHVHTLLCYSDANADLETSADWEKTIQSLSFKPAEDLAMVARSQIGYTESQRNYKVAEDGVTKQGYTRYGEWYGNPYGNWNAMFVSFCLHYAEHPAYETLKNSGAESMRLAAEQAGVYQAAAGTIPYVGDLAFLDKDSNGSCDTVAIVSGREEGGMTLVEGDCGGAVAENRYSLDNGTVLGYALLTPQTMTTEELDDELGDNTVRTVDAEPIQDGDITITFVIGQKNYTYDPSSGNTHVTVNLTTKDDPAGDGFSSDGGLRYTYWRQDDTKFIHTITGTGTLMTRSIRAGTTLEDSGYSLPVITAANIGNTNTYSYLSSLSWVTEGGMICNKKTEFAKDTTLYLHLYESGTTCGLNWVCNCDSGGAHSVTAYVSGFDSPTFAWGQSVSDPYIPTAEAVNSKYTGSQYCTAGPDHGMQFAGWFVKDSSGKEIEFGAGVPILEDYKDPNSDGYSVKVYARWEEAEEPETPVTVTATFVNGTETTAKTLNKGEALGENLPVVTAPDDKIFVGWKIGEIETYATAETVLSEDTTFTAVFVDKVTVTFKNGEETVETRNLEVNTAVGELPAVTAPEGKSFLGWVQLLENDETGTQYLESGTVITGDATYVPVFTDLVSITFMNGEVQFGDTISVPVGTVLWSYLPAENPVYSGDSEAPMEFSGWKINDTDSFVTEQTVAASGMVLHAAFEEVTGFAIYLHDIAPDGVTDYETEEGYQISQTNLEVGKTLAQELAENPYYMIHDNALASECKWYIKRLVDGVETYTEYNLDAKVTSELHLYTFNYSVTLTREEPTTRASFLNLFTVASAAEVEVSEDGNTLTLTIRENARPTAADFVVNGVDYTLYDWKYTDSNGVEQTLDISGIIANGVTENIRASAASDALKISPSENATKTINFYVFIDGRRTLVESRTVTVYRFDQNPRWYIPSATLESVYGKFGFIESQLTAGTRYFPHVDTGKSTIWADTDVYAADINNDATPDVYLSPVTNNNNSTCDVYYLPHQTLEKTSGDYNNYLTTDSFYSINVLDPAGNLYKEEELPPNAYVLTGNSYAITLKYREDIPWVLNGEQINLENGNGYTVTRNEAEGTITVTFEHVTEPKSFVLGNYVSFTVNYDINISNTAAIVNEVPKINGAQSFVDTVAFEGSGTYIVKTPSRTQYTMNNYLNSAFDVYVFQGWRVKHNYEMLSAGTVLSSEQVITYNGTSLNLEAVWEQQNLSDSVSFYINLELGETGGEKKNFTNAVYGTTISYDPVITFTEGETLNSNYQNLEEADATIRGMVNGQKLSIPVGTNGNQDVTFTVATIPNDEQMLAFARERQTTYIADFTQSDMTIEEYRDMGQKIICAPDANGVLQYIPVEELTSENYAIRWYSLKYQGNNLAASRDGWHIDGALIKKQGYLTVTKTFYGDPETVTSIIQNNDYKITVQNADGTTNTTLGLPNSTNSTAPTYSSGNTYTWVIPLDAGKVYTLQEENFDGSGDNIATLAEYQIDNPVPIDDTTPEKGRQTYDGGVQVKVKAYNADIPYTGYQTVNFYNGYLDKETLNISKVDDSGKPLPGVSFKLYENGAVMDIWKVGDVYYSYDLTNETIDGKEDVETDLITVDALGNAQIIGLMKEGSNATFTLKEASTPEGYGQIADILFSTVYDTTGNGNHRYSLQNNQRDDVTLLGGNTMRIINTSDTMDVTVQKNWLDQKNIPVKVKLVLGDTVLGYEEKTLDTSNNWTATWEDVPAYVGGELANYSVRETWIGNTAYNGSYADGYNDYLVNVAAPVYTYGDNGLPTAVTITVTNRVYEGGLQFTKVDEKGNGLARAGFQLFTDEACVNEYGFGAVSDLYGNVNFGSLAAGTYYMKEVRTPAGYQENTTLYKIVVTGTGTTITVADDETNTPISTIVNIPATASLKVKKVDGSGKPLTGASFEVYMKDSEGVYSEKITREINGVTVNKYWVDTAGLLTVPDLMPGDYKLVEVDAPDGYYRMTEEIEFNVALAAIVARDTDTDNSWSFDGTTITVVNVAGSELPHTGGMGTHFGTMAGLLMMASSLLYGFLLRRKRERRGV